MNNTRTIACNLKAVTHAFAAMVAMLFSSMVFAQTGGLAQATTTMNEIKLWGYGFLGVVVFVYLMYNVVMALLDRKQWADVLVAVGYIAIAGAVLVIAEWAWGLWGG